MWNPSSRFLEIACEFWKLIPFGTVKLIATFQRPLPEIKICWQHEKLLWEVVLDISEELGSLIGPKTIAEELFKKWERSINERMIGT